MKRKWMIAVLTATLVGTFSGCGQTNDNQNKVQKAKGVNEVTAYVGTSIFESSLDPVKGAMSYGYPFINNALLKVNSDSEYVGDLATKWSISEDALTYTFNLKEGIQFSDGSDLTAEDVVFTYNMVHENQGNNENVDLSCLESIKALDDYTVEMKLSKPYSPFFDTVAMLQIVPSDAYDSTRFDTMPIGTGAYKMVQYDTNQQMILEANENYFGQKPEIEKVTLVYMDSAAAFAAAQSGQLDIVMVGAGYAQEEIPGMELETFETMDVRNISLPLAPKHTVSDANGNEVVVGNNVTCDKAVRGALSIGIDRERIIQNAFNGVGVPAIHFTNNLVWASDETYTDGRIEEAKKLLEVAGWIDEDGDGIREKEGQECSFDVYAAGGDEERYRLAVAMAEDSLPLGIKIEVKTTTWDEVSSLQLTSGIVWGWGQYSPTVLNSLFNSKLILSGGYDNAVGFNDTEVDAEIEEALTANNQKEAVKAWREVQRLADAEYPYLYLVNIQHCYFVNDKLDLSMATQIPHPHGHGSPIVCNIGDWKWK